jgi:hypothetical protein
MNGAQPALGAGRRRELICPANLTPEQVELAAQVKRLHDEVLARQRDTERGSEMSERLLKNLEELMASIIENSPKLEERLGQSDPGAISAAKYHEALERLSRE